MKILIIDNDPRVRNVLNTLLKDEFIVDTASNAEEAESLAYSTPYDAIITADILPDMDGSVLCSLLKTRLPETPIIVISSNSSVSDKEKLFNKGIDDYIVKPVSSRELRMRIHAVVRRQQKEAYPFELEVKDLKIDLKTKKVTINDQRVMLRRKEFQLLEFLLVNKGRVINRGELLESVWDRNVNPFTNTVEVHIKRLRDQLKKYSNEEHIETVYGLGYLVE